MLRRVWLFVLGVSFLVGDCVLSPVEDLPARGHTETPGDSGRDGNSGTDGSSGGPVGDLPAEPGGQVLRAMVTSKAKSCPSSPAAALPSSRSVSALMLTLPSARSARS